MNRREILKAGAGALSMTAALPHLAIRPSEISGPAGQAVDSVFARRRDRHRRPPLGGAHEGAARHHLRREPGRRRRHHRRDRGGALASRRPHHPARQHQRAGAQPDDVDETVLRPGQGLRADLHPLRGVGGAGGQRNAAGEDAQGVRRIRQGQSGQAVVRLGRHRHDDASRRASSSSSRPGSPISRTFPTRAPGRASPIW